MLNVSIEAARNDKSILEFLNSTSNLLLNLRNFGQPLGPQELSVNSSRRC